MNKIDKITYLVAFICIGTALGYYIDIIQKMQETDYKAKITTELAHNISKEYRLTLQESQLLNPPQAVVCHYYEFRKHLAIDDYNYLYLDGKQIWVYNVEEGTAYIYYLTIRNNGAKMEWAHR